MITTVVKTFYKNQDLLYKLLLIATCAVLIVYFLPKSGKFQYDFQKGFPWANENLYADEDFAILKSEETLEQEREEIRSQAFLYFEYDENVVDDAIARYDAAFPNVFKDSLIVNVSKSRLKKFGRDLLTEIYTTGIAKQKPALDTSRLAYLKNGSEVTQVNLGQIYEASEVPSVLQERLDDSNYATYKNLFLQVFYDSILPNAVYNATLTQNTISDELSQLSPTRGVVTKGSRIIARGELVEGEALQKMISLKAKYETQNFSDSRYNWILVGYIVLVVLALVMLLLFIRNYRPKVYENNTQITFILFNVLLMVLLTTAVVKFNPAYVYAVPLCILPLIIKAFFDARLGLFTHVITILLLGFIVPDSFEYFFLQVIAGIVTILSTQELYKRANLFISVGQITLIYIIAYFAFNSIHQGGVENLEWENLGLFVLAGLATLFVQPLIYIYEKIFGLMSDVSLLELSDTNSKLLKLLADKAPGTFHHSLNVANLCEAAANEIGANAMLVRVGALYHDIGKMNNPTDFTENQSTGINVHDELSPKESARIIIDHVIDGIEIARKNNLPDRVIDFIRTHHGTSTVHYFYMKEKEVNEDAVITDFQYPGPLPFSKETAILMMSDSVEAASKSLKNPTSILIDSFVEKIIKKQMDDGQYLNADITFKEIQQVKKVLKKKLVNIYHLRIEYPE
ncbi:HDIG domain-containing metalloprotein [uncultured Dokdonia sp.]|uniref:HD family phosphohydrolase n=1 Tax=uncultured Dokdonia sp. TaxID=575653 RepID=UPI002639D3AE|nr:HDIG domain-containing metalloprotein [uncultured Dokdonia sp.]